MNMKCPHRPDGCPNYWQFAAEIQLLVILFPILLVWYLVELRPRDFFRDLARA